MYSKTLHHCEPRRLYSTTNIKLCIVIIAASGKDLYDILWTAIRRLKEIGLTVMLLPIESFSNCIRTKNV